ncbi:MAG TPA: serine hydrolase domain-containing protein [Candidatus Udaeobacter sp.]|nr:serine hydrolase domain-containing protein [Candidatus Udaeobacter sp.]
MRPELEKLVRDGMSRYHVPGIAIGILHDGDEDIAAYGVTNLEHPLPVDADTLFQIASITKTITATVVMRLVERGALDLDSPIRRYLPEFKLRDEEVAKRATLRHLVTHTGGWLGDCFADFGKGDDALARYVAAMAELEQLTPLGEIWHYSNSSFAVLGRLIEVVTGKTYEAAVRELLFIPLGMAKSCFNADDAITHRVAAGHVIVDEQPRVARPWAFPRATTPVGGVVSSVRELLRYARFHLGDGRTQDGGRLLSVGSLELMRTRLAPADNDRAVGVAWFLREIGGVTIQYHAGAAIGQQGVLMLAPERGFAIAVQTNSGRGGLLHGDVTKWALKTFVGVDDPEPAHVRMTKSRRDELVARYTAALADVELRAGGEGVLLLRSISHNVLDVKPAPTDPAPAPVAFIGEDRFVCLEGPMKDVRGEVLRDSAGSVRWIRAGGRVYRRLES